MSDYGAMLKSVTGALGLEIDGEQSGLRFVPALDVEVEDDAFAVCEDMMERLLAVDDVDAVYSNCAGLE